MRWHVTTKENPTGEGVLADRLEVKDGCLVFTNDADDGNDSTVITYTQGAWLVAFAEGA